jgi:hypothetical protein
VSWAALEAAAPELARLGRERLEEAGLAYLGTLRADGWPRIAPVEAHVVGDRLVVGVMRRSLKARDLERDPRCTLQSAVSGPDSGEGELKLSGRLIESDDEELSTAPGTWWAGRPREQARVCVFEIESAAFVSWDTARGEMTVRHWAPGDAERISTRAYP